MKIIVFGTSYCGSTAFAGALQNIPDVLAIGEAHWLIDAPKQLGRKAHCTICGKDKCSLIDPLAANPPTDSHLYDRLLLKGKKKHLVTTDKAGYFVQRFAKRQSIVGIVLFKSPEAMLASGKRHSNNWEQSWGGTLGMYAGFYDSLLAFVQNWCSDWFAVESEVFFSKPADETEVICDHLGLKRPESFVFPPKDWHNVGGNPAYKNPHFKNVLQPDLRWKTELTHEEKELACFHKPSRQTWCKLRHRCLDRKTA